MSNKKFEQTPVKETPKPVAAVATAPAATAVAAAVKAPVMVVAPAPAAASVATATTAAPAAPAAAERDRSALVALIAKLRELDADTARDAAATLGTLPADDAAIDALSGVLTNKDNYFHPVVRAAAAAALGQLKSPRGLDALLLATRDSMAETSDEAVKALGLLKDARALPTLRAIIANADGFFLPNVQRSAQQAAALIAPKA